MKFEWESIFEFSSSVATRFSGRAKVKGGWIVHDFIRNDKSMEMTGSMVFVPDPNHEWEIDDNILE